MDEYELKNPYGLETQSDFHQTRAATTINIVRQYSEATEMKNILDVGCGKGIITKQIKKVFPNIQIDAIDISEKAIELAKKDFSGINFFVADGMKLDNWEQRYDIIILNNLYEHIENPTGMLKNLKKILKKEGVFIISTPNRYFIRNVLRKLFGLNIVIPTHHITEYSIGQIYDHHLYAGLSIKQIIFPKFKRVRWRISDVLIFKLIQPLADGYLSLMKSKTKMGNLLFIVSIKK